jgi:hypothetical protein
MFYQMKKKREWSWENKKYAQQMNQEKNAVSHVQLVVQHVAKLRVLANITWRKITKQVHKNSSIIPVRYSNISFKKLS